MVTDNKKRSLIVTITFLYYVNTTVNVAISCYHNVVIYCYEYMVIIATYVDDACRGGHS